MSQMPLYSRRIFKGHGLAQTLINRLPILNLVWDQRQKSRFDAITQSGEHVGVLLPRGQLLRGGDVLVSTNGELLRIEAAAQQVMRITPCPEHGRSFDLIRAAYHLGNRHVPIELTPTYLQIEPDAVLADMLRAMHMVVTECEAAFEPEAGAYGNAAHGHSHAHDHDHHHHHGHDHDLSIKGGHQT